jgi:tRNA pseudouridine38-40 synthase
MPRFKITIEYDGSNLYGWQFQKEKPTVQGRFFDACKTVFHTDVFEFYGSGRTDGGVHAIAQVAHLDVKTDLTLIQIQHKLNDELPANINVLKVEDAAPRFHARYDAVYRSYIYVISTRRTAFGKKYTWWIKDKLNVQAMADAALLFEGLKDYSSFGESENEESSTKVEIKSAKIFVEDDLIVVHIVGSHFLWKMVRRMVGILVEVGRGNVDHEKINSLFKKQSDFPAQFTAPPSGLYLERVYFPGDKLDEEPRNILSVFSIG